MEKRSGRPGAGVDKFNRINEQRRAATGFLLTQSAVSAPPLLIEDVNDDNVPELCISFFTNEGGKPRRWIELLSGVDGERLWENDFPVEWFQLQPGQHPPARFSMPLTNSHRFGAGGLDSITQNGRTSRRPPFPADYRIVNTSDYVNGRPQLAMFGDQRLIVLPAGDRIVGFAPTSGDRAFVAAVKTRPALEPRWADVDGDNFDDAVFLHERLPAAPANQYRMATLAVWSGRAKEISWTNQLPAYWPASYGERVADPKWPLVDDIDGDGKSEILVASESSWQGTGFNRATPWGQVSAFSGSGKELWNARILTKDQQCNQFIVGPDINGDNVKDMFAAAPWGKDESIFVEAISGIDGKTLWTRKQSGNDAAFRSSGRGQIADLLWRRTSDKKVELIVVAAPARYSAKTTLTTAIISAHTGEIIGAMDEPPARVHCVDFDADGAEEIVTFANRKARGDVNDGGKAGHHPWRRATTLEPPWKAFSADRRH